MFSYNMTFMITISTQAFLNSYFGHSILTASDRLFNAAYFSKWYSMTNSYRKDLVILMERLKINSELRAGKLFSMNLTLFGTVWLILPYNFDLLLHLAIHFKIMNFAYRLYSILQGGSFWGNYSGW